MANRGILVVVSGFSGAGKGTLMKHLLEKYDNYALSISATTRAPREGEEHGREYFFHTKQEFEELILQDALIEYAQYVENYYGTPKAYVEKQLEAGKDVILEIEIQGALKVKEKFPDTLLLFVTPPSAEFFWNSHINIQISMIYGFHLYRNFFLFINHLSSSEPSHALNHVVLFSAVLYLPVA